MEARRKKGTLLNAESFIIFKGIMPSSWADGGTIINSKREGQGVSSRGESVAGILEPPG